MSSTSTPAERLAVTPIDPRRPMDRYELYDRLLQLDNPLSDPDNHGLSWYDLAVSSKHDAELAADALYLRGEWRQCLDWCRKTGEATAYYLMGDWKSKQRHDDGTIDPNAWFENEATMTSWVMYLELGLGWSAIGGHWDVVDRLLDFPTESSTPRRAVRIRKSSRTPSSFEKPTVGYSKWAYGVNLLCHLGERVDGVFRQYHQASVDPLCGLAIC